MRETPYKVQLRIKALIAVSQLPTLGERAKLRQKLLAREPFPARFATYAEAKQAAEAAGPEFEVVVQS